MQLSQTLYIFIFSVVSSGVISTTPSYMLFKGILSEIDNLIVPYVSFVLATTLLPNALLLFFEALGTYPKPNSMLPLLAYQLPCFDDALPTQT